MFSSHTPGSHTAWRRTAELGICLGTGPLWGSDVNKCHWFVQHLLPEPEAEGPFFSQDMPNDRSRGVPAHQAFLEWARQMEIPQCGAAFQGTGSENCPPPSKELYLLAKVVLHPLEPPTSILTRRKARQRHRKQLLKQRWKGPASLYHHKRHCVIRPCTIFQHYSLHRACQWGAVQLCKQMWWWVQSCWV